MFVKLIPNIYAFMPPIINKQYSTILLIKSASSE
jgi:hypothetical protein